MLNICMALATGPRLLLLDEPVAGMNPTESRTVADLIQQLREEGISVVLAEHDMRTVMRLCDRVVVLDRGTTIMEGTPLQVQENPAVIKAYLGRPAHGR